MDLSFFSNTENLDAAPLYLKLLVAYIAGLLTSLTPCVYPLIPITVASLSGGAEATKRQAVMHSLAYVFGIVVTFSCLGMISAKSGAYFGVFLGNPIVAVGLFLLFVFLSAWTLDLVGLGFASRIQRLASLFNGRGLSGAFIMGSLSGFVAAPCAGPILIAILGIAALSGHAILGFTLLSTYALGFGTLFLFLGIFSQAISLLPKSGDWLHAIKYIIAVSLMIAGLFILRPIIHEQLAMISYRAVPLYALSLLALGITYTLYAYKSPRAGHRFFSCIVLALGLFQVVVPAPALTSPLPWKLTIESGLQESKASGKILMVDFFADWCAGCLEYDTKTFSDIKVRDALAKFNLAREDFTTLTERTESLSAKFKIEGLPTIIFISPNGEEIKDKRISGYLDPDNFLSKINGVIQSNK